MTKIACISDLHLGATPSKFGGQYKYGMNDRDRLVFEVLNNTIDRINAKACNSLIVAGDIFDNVNPTPQVIYEAQKAFSKFAGRTFFLLGNHDMVSNVYGDHALMPLYKQGEIIEEPDWHTLGTDVIFIPFRNGPAKDWFPQDLESIAGCINGKDKLLVTHLGISDRVTPPWLRGTNDSIELSQLEDLCYKYGIHTVMSGNWHQKRRWDNKGLTVLQVGALTPTGFNNPGLFKYGTLATWDSKLGLSTEEMPGPRFEKVYCQEDLEKIDPKGKTLFIQWVTEPQNISIAKGVLNDYIVSGKIKNGEVVMDELEAQAAVRTAATVAKSADTFEEALKSYIDQMPVPEGVDKLEVLARTKEFMK